MAMTSCKPPKPRHFDASFALIGEFPQKPQPDATASLSAPIPSFAMFPAIGSEDVLGILSISKLCGTKNLG